MTTQPEPENSPQPETLAKIGAALGISGLGPVAAGSAVGSEIQRVAVKLATLVDCGTALGLAQHQIRRVIKRWHKHYTNTGRPTNWAQIQAALLRYSNNQRWWP